jgi:hypothetical protein
MITKDFAERTRARFSETRAVVAKLRELSKGVGTGAAKDRGALSDRGDGVVR